MFVKAANGRYYPLTEVREFHLDGPDPNGNWLVRFTGPITGTVELGSFPTQVDGEAALAKLVANFGVSEVSA